MSAFDLSAAEQKVAATLGLSPADMARAKGRRELAANRGDLGLSDAERRVCLQMGISQRRFAVSKAGAPRTAGLRRAHQEVERAYAEAYKSGGTGRGGEAWLNAPDQELLDIAISELRKFNLDKEEDTYSNLLNGTLHAMCLLERIAGPYAPLPAKAKGAGELAGRSGRFASGLVRAHQEIDRVHAELYEGSGRGSDARPNVSDQKLLDTAISELQKFNPDKEEDTYGNLLSGTWRAMCLLERIAGPYAEGGTGPAREHAALTRPIQARRTSLQVRGLEP